MCGFAGFFEPKRLFSPELIKGADRDLFHRGPDSGGSIVEPGFALVFRRLSIIDLSEAADQPMSDDTGRYTIVLNGEIYNYIILRDELKSIGVEFRTSSDTEVVLKGYMTWGEKILDRLEGMYAFSIVDRVKSRAIVARDPFGIKPLYIARKGKTTAFASEMRVLTRIVNPEIDNKALAELLTFGWAAGEKSNLKGIEKVKGGWLYTICLDTGQLTQRCFYDILEMFDHEMPMKTEQAVETAESEIKASLKAHLMSDVGYALQLSGGVDSSLIAALASMETDWQISSFAVNIGDHPLNEGEYRKDVVSRYHLKHHEIFLGDSDFADALERAIWHMEGPVPHLGCVMLMLICEEIKQVTKVVLTGEGADEMFGGYERYSIWRKLGFQEKIARFLPTSLLPDRQPFLGVKRLNGFDGAVYASVYRDFRALHRIFPEVIPEPGFREKTSSRFRKFINRLFAVDQTCYLESLLTRQDKMSMASSIEARVPFVHLPMAPKLNSMPRNIMAPGGITKPILKKVAEHYLPESLIYRRKNGLLLPFSEWLKKPNGIGRFLDYLTEPGCRLTNYCNPAILRKIVDGFRKDDHNNSSLIIHLINNEIWLRTYPSLTSEA